MATKKARRVVKTELEVGMPAHARDPKPAPTETVTYYGEVTGVRKGHVEGTATVTVHMRHVEDWPDEITMPVKFAPCLGDVCKVTFSKPEAV